MKEEDIKNNAVAFAKEYKKEIAFNITDPTIYVPEINPISVFMAGSPGAGKTESSKWLVKKIAGDDPLQNILRIDTDELRDIFITMGYNGNNSHLFQFPSSILTSKIHDFALKNSQSFIFDGTFSNLERAKENIRRSLKRNRFVQILYVYQDPIQAWSFVKEREVKEGRRIRKEDFILKYLDSRSVVNHVKQEFGSLIQVDLLHKNNDFTHKLYKRNIKSIDTHVPEAYTYEILMELLS